MPQIAVSEADFEAVAGAAIDAWEEGYIDRAEALDKVARKINAALAYACLPKIPHRTPKQSWRDVPSVLAHLKRATELKE